MSLYLGENLISGQATLVGESRNIGQIIHSTIPQIDAGLHLLDGALINGSGIYSAFVTHIAGLVSTYPNLFVSESDWQTAVTTYGVCGKFVYDNVNNTVRLPKVTGIIEGTTDLNALGDLVEAGLPDHIHLQGATVMTQVNASGPWFTGNGSIRYGNISETAGVSNNPIYGNSTTVQPQTIKAFYYIVIATTTKTDIEVDIDEIATDLNGKADTDLSNVPASKGILSERYVNGTSWYRVYADGWCEQGGGDITSSGNVNFLKPFKDTNYCLTGSIGHGTNSNTWEHFDMQKSSNSYFYQNCCFDGYKLVSWYACGYIN